MTTATATERRPSLGPVGRVVDQFIGSAQRGYLADRREAVSLLAQLRRGAGKPAEAMPELWELTAAEALYDNEALRGEAAATQAEAAAHIAVTLYALHQQSNREKGMHRPGPELGEAVRRLMPDGIDEPVRRRFVRVGASVTLDVLTYRLREIVTLLRRERIPLDYGLLADRLYQAQQPGGMHRVRRAWGRSFHAFHNKPASPKDDTNNNSTAKEAP